MDIEKPDGGLSELTDVLEGFSERGKNMEWQPIESAPMDGSEFLATWGRQGFVMMIMYYNKVHGYWATKGSFVGGFKENATHWMPLPAPPSNAIVSGLPRKGETE